jgi:energy-coupling factor transporter ATP-binding protein EcfA2
MDLRTIKFGAPAAERDVNYGLYDYFVESEAFKRVASGQKTLVLGNRGSGKSAIFKVFANREREKGAVVLELAPEDYSYEMLQSVLRREEEGAWAKHSAFAASWKFLILVLVMKQLTVSGPKFKKGASGRVYSYLRDNYRGVQDSPISMLVSYMKRIEGIKVGAYEAALKTRQLASLYKLEELDPYIADIKELDSAKFSE